MIAAILSAAGLGERFRHQPDDSPKQFQMLADKPIFIWSLQVLCLAARIYKVIVAVPPDSFSAVDEDLSTYLEDDARKKVLVIAGGDTRQDSVRNGLEALDKAYPRPEFVLVHDAARPFLNSGMISDVIQSVSEYGACSLAVQATDTIKRVGQGVMQETLDRDQLVMVQTPQAGRFDWLLEGHRKAEMDGFRATDDSAVLEHAGHSVHVVPGSRYNLKITTREDFALCQYLAKIAREGV